MSMTDDINAALCTYLLNQVTPLTLLTNWKPHHWEMDLAMILKDKSLNEYEIKISRGDFQKDLKLKHKKHTYYNSVRSSRKDQWSELGATPQKFYYVCPKGLIEPDEVPTYAGLIYYNDAISLEEKSIKHSFRSVKKCLKLHRSPINPNLIIKMQTAQCFRMAKHLRDISKLQTRIYNA